MVAVAPTLKTLASLRKENKELAIHALREMILDVFSFYAETIEQDHIDIITDSIMENAYYFNGADLLLFKKQCVEGKFKYKTTITEFGGKRSEITKYDFYKLTPPVFLEWVQAYQENRIKEFQTVNDTKSANKSESAEITQRSLEIIKEILEVTKPKEDAKNEVKIEPLPQIGYHKAIKDYQMYLSAKFDEIAIKDKEDDRGNTFPPHIEVANKPILKMDWVNLEYSKTYESIREKYESAENISFEDFYTTELNKILNS